MTPLRQQSIDSYTQFVRKLRLAHVDSPKTVTPALLLCRAIPSAECQPRRRETISAKYEGFELWGCANGRRQRRTDRFRGAWLKNPVSFADSVLQIRGSVLDGPPDWSKTPPCIRDLLTKETFPVLRRANTSKCR